MIEVIKNESIRRALDGVSHQYLAGTLSRPQTLSHIEDGQVNVGIGHHHAFGSEPAHYHTDCTEYQYVISGEAKYLDLDTGEEFHVAKGDFFVVRPMTRYTLKAQRGCEIIFFKVPAINDKVLLDEHDELLPLIKSWQASWESAWGQDAPAPAKRRSRFVKDSKMVAFYKGKKKIPPTSIRRNVSLDVIGSIAKGAAVNSGGVLAFLFSIVGFMECFGFFEELLDMRLFIGIVVTAISVFVGSAIWYFYCYQQRIISMDMGYFDLDVYEDDYIANMIRVLEENAQKNTHAVFAIGMNESILASPHDADGNRIKYKSLAEDFYAFMLRYFGINITKEIQERFANEKLPKCGEVFPMEFTLEHASCNELRGLEGQSFSVLFYVNSHNKGGQASQAVVEDPRLTVIHLVDAASDYIYELRKGRYSEVVLMLPAIGTGKTGRGPYKHIIFETLNNLALPNLALPNKVILSLRDYTLLGVNLEAERVLSQAKRAFFS